MTLREKIDCLGVMADNNISCSTNLPQMLRSIEEDIYTKHDTIKVTYTAKLISYLSHLKNLNLDVGWLLDKTKSKGRKGRYDKAHIAHHLMHAGEIEHAEKVLLDLETSIKKIKKVKGRARGRIASAMEHINGPERYPKLNKIMLKHI